jgi:uncharacterized protein (DUF58 family)
MPARQSELLSAPFMAQLERLALLARRPVRGWSAGQRRSRRAGRSVEFCDYRPYAAGDDLRYVDWNILGRTNRMMVKLFVDDEELCLHLLVDASASMDWGDPSKLQWATRLAAALGFIGLSGLERVGLGIMRERVTDGWRPARGRGQVSGLLEFLASVQAGGTTGLKESLAQYAARTSGTGLVVLVSDLLDPSGYEAGLRSLLERRLEIHVVHVLSPQEMKPSLDGDLRLIDAETGEARLLRIDEPMLGRYQERLQRFCDRAEAFCRANSIGYHRASSDTGLEQFILTTLRGRLLS